jgi:sulfoxide reductase heme-binding subunit YedZ
MSTDAVWYLARGSGVTSLILFTVVVALGIGTRRGLAFTGMPRLVVASVHRSASLLALAFLAVHVTSLMFEPFTQLGIVDLVVPFTSAYRPLWVGAGALAFDLALAVIVTSLLRDRLGRRAWWAVHGLAYAMWPVALLHGIGSGTDRSTIWMIGVDLACVIAVVTVAVTTHPALTGPADVTPRRVEHERVEAR